MLMFPNFETQMVNIIRAHPDHEVIIGADTLQNCFTYLNNVRMQC
jgi:hypothetical protein